MTVVGKFICKKSTTSNSEWISPSSLQVQKGYHILSVSNDLFHIATPEENAHLAHLLFSLEVVPCRIRMMLACSRRCSSTQGHHTACSTVPSVHMLAIHSPLIALEYIYLHQIYAPSSPQHRHFLLKAGMSTLHGSALLALAVENHKEDRLKLVKYKRFKFLFHVQLYSMLLCPRKITRQRRKSRKRAGGLT
jgi:hypothetical protein